MPLQKWVERWRSKGSNRRIYSLRDEIKQLIANYATNSKFKHDVLKNILRECVYTPDLQKWLKLDLTELIGKSNFDPEICQIVASLDGKMFRTIKGKDSKWMEGSPYLKARCDIDQHVKRRTFFDFFRTNRQRYLNNLMKSDDVPSQAACRLIR